MNTMSWFSKMMMITLVMLVVIPSTSVLGKEPLPQYQESSTDIMHILDFKNWHNNIWFYLNRGCSAISCSYEESGLEAFSYASNEQSAGNDDEEPTWEPQHSPQSTLISPDPEPRYTASGERILIRKKRI